MADGVEAELKVAVDAAGASRLARLSALPGLSVVAKGDKRLVSTYFDTPDLALRAKGISLRLRRSGRSGEQTVKFSGSFSLGLAERPEFNVPHAGRVPDLTRLPDEAAAAMLRRNLLIYGLGGVIVPFIGIKIIDLILTAVQGV